MLHTVGLILLTIAKIIGICLGAILALILLLLCILLFVPVRYRSYGVWEETEKNVSFQISWLLSIIKVGAIYHNGDVSYGVRVLGITIFPKKKRRKKQEKSDNLAKADERAKESSRQEKKVLSEGKSEVTDTAKTDRTGFKEAEKIPEAEKFYISDDDKNETSDISGDIEDEISESEEDTGIFHRLSERVSKIKEKILGIVEKIRGLPNTFKKNLEKAGKIKEKITEWKDFLELEETKMSLAAIKQEVKRVFRYLLPVRGRGYIHFGLSDPADTGRILGFISIFYGFFPKNLELEPDFCGTIFEGNWKFRGRIRAVYFLRMFLRLIRKTEIRITYKRVSKMWR